MHQFQQLQRNLWQNYSPMNMAAAMGMTQQVSIFLMSQFRYKYLDKFFSNRCQNFIQKLQPFLTLSSKYRHICWYLTGDSSSKKFLLCFP
jgi:hypothetical protein